MIYSLIPAKTKSSRLPGKNTFKFFLGDKPLIAYTIEAVKEAGIHPLVFTNEKNIFNNTDAVIIPRNDDVSGLQATMKETVSAFIYKMNLKKDDVILLTYLTCPFRTSESIQKAIKLFHTTKADSLQSVTAVDYRPYGLMQKQKNHKFKCLQSQKNYYQKQNTPTLYKANGAIYIFKVSELVKLNNQMFNDDTVGYELDSIEGLDIDTKEDLMFAEKIMENRKNERLNYQLSGERDIKTKRSSFRGGVRFKCIETIRT